MSISNIVARTCKPTFSHAKVPHRYTLTVMPDFGQAAAWLKHAHDTSRSVGEHQSMRSLLQIDDDIVCCVPCWLWDSLDAWQLRFERDVSVVPGKDSTLDWKAFHYEGLFLSALLQQVVAPEGVAVRYEYPYEDPQHDVRDPVIMTPLTCAQAKAQYLKFCVPSKEWSFNTLRDTLLAQELDVSIAQQILDQAAGAWCLKPYALELPNTVLDVDINS